MHRDQVANETVDVVCGLADLRTIGGASPNVYTANSTTYSGRFPNLMSGAETVRVTSAALPGLLCTTSDGEDFTLFKPVTTSWTPINHRNVVTLSPGITPSGARQNLLTELTG